MAHFPGFDGATIYDQFVASSRTASAYTPVASRSARRQAHAPLRCPRIRASRRAHAIQPRLLRPGTRDCH